MTTMYILYNISMQNTMYDYYNLNIAMEKFHGLE